MFSPYSVRISLFYALDGERQCFRCCAGGVMDQGHVEEVACEMIT